MDIWLHLVVEYRQTRYHIDIISDISIDDVFRLRDTLAIPKRFDTLAIANGPIRPDRLDRLNSWSSPNQPNSSESEPLTVRIARIDVMIWTKILNTPISKIF